MTETSLAEKKPVGIQRKRTKGFKLPPDTISVCRPGEWGNPHKVFVKGTEQIAVNLFEQDLVDKTFVDRRGKPMIDRIDELKGKNLACFCPLGQPCHRDILLKYANRE